MKKQIAINLFVLIVYIAEAQGQSNDKSQDYRHYNSFEFIFLDNGKTGDSQGLSDSQIGSLISITNNIADKEKRNTYFMLYESNALDPIIYTDIAGRERYANELLDQNYNVAPKFSFDEKSILEKLYTGTPSMVDNEINLYFFFQDKFFASNLTKNRSEISKYLNLLPRSIAAIIGAPNVVINLHVYLPMQLQNYTTDDAKARLTDIQEFERTDDRFSRVNLFFY